jgi:hypothetical protein
MVNFAALAVIGALAAAATQPVHNTCVSGTPTPRVSQADMASAQAVIGVKVEQVERLPYTRCRSTLLALWAEGSSMYKAGERFTVETHCANANTLLRHPDAWIYSDVPVVGEQGRLYIPPANVVPPGSHYVADRNQGTLEAARTGHDQAGCSG